MTQTEFRKKLSQTENTKWFNSVEFELNYPHLNLDFKFTGFGHLHKFVNQQINGWGKKTDNFPKELIESKKHFEYIENHLVKFIDSYGAQPNEANLNNWIRTVKTQIQNNVAEKFPFDCPQVDFLNEVYQNHPESFISSFAYLTGNLKENIHIKNNFNGYLLAYEFTLKDSTEITERRNKEKQSLSTLRTNFENSLPKLESELVEHLKASKEKYEEYSKNLDKFKEAKEKSYTDWFDKTKTDFQTFSTESDERLEELENTYQEKLKLEEPAKYWSERAGKLKTQGWFSLGILVVLVLIVAYTLREILWTAPEQIYVSFFDGDKSAAIRWSIIYITLISFMAFSIKAILKVMFSSFHLARDCEERHTLTYFYLSLLKDSSVDKEDKKLIMQALFSRAETGLLKDDSSPTMPNDIIGKVFSR